jgi:hypothetical protein
VCRKIGWKKYGKIEKIEKLRKAKHNESEGNVEKN